MTRSTGSAAGCSLAMPASTRLASPESSPGWAPATPTARSVPPTSPRNYSARPTSPTDALEARRLLVAFYEYGTSNDVPKLERLARTIARWEEPILRWHRTRLSNAATEATNLIIKNIKRLGFGFRNLDNYRPRPLLRCGAPWQHSPRRINTTPPTTLGRVEPLRCPPLSRPWSIG